MLTTNTPPAVGQLYRFASRKDEDVPETRKAIAESLEIAAKMREAALKSSIFVGVPRVRAR